MKLREGTLSPPHRWWQHSGERQSQRTLSPITYHYLKINVVELFLSHWGFFTLGAFLYVQTVLFQDDKIRD